MKINFSWLILFPFLLKSIKSQFSQPGLCVIKCICIQHTDRMVACNKADSVTAIPVNVPLKYSRLMIQNSDFNSPTIYKHNMTGLEHINYLKIVYCGIEAVEESAFENMQKLEYLDLSHNHIKIISPYTFAGLNLKSLHLMENAGMKLDIKSFAGLKVKEINLRSNLITKLHSTQFFNIGVEKLYLFNNSLRSLDQSLAEIFDKPGHLIDVTKNPLHCDCHLRWMAKNLQRQPIENIKYVNITCSSPHLLFQRSLISLTDNDLNCPQPHIHSLSVDFSTVQTQLSCMATSSFREPEIAWTYEENGQQKEFRKIRSSNDITNRYEGISNTKFSVNVSIPANEKRSFTCSTWTKNSEPQKVTVQIRTPKIEYQKPFIKISKTVPPDRINSNTIEDSNYLFTKQFTILEMIGAVVGTFALTVFFLILVARFIRLYRYRLAKTASLKPYWPHNPGQDSMYSQPISHNGEYDIPRVCETHTFPPPPSFDHIEFLDFKNHNKLYPNGS